MDKFIGRLKTVACACLATGAIFMLLFVIELRQEDNEDEVTGVITPNTSKLYAYCIGGGFFINTAIPLFYELIVESTYGKYSFHSLSITILWYINMMINFIHKLIILSLLTFTFLF